MGAERAEVGTKAEQPPRQRQRHGDARRRRGSEDFEGVSRAAEGKGSGAAELVSPFGGSE